MNLLNKRSKLVFAILVLFCLCLVFTFFFFSILRFYISPTNSTVAQVESISRTKTVTTVFYSYQINNQMINSKGRIMIVGFLLKRPTEIRIRYLIKDVEQSYFDEYLLYSCSLFLFFSIIFFGALLFLVFGISRKLPARLQDNFSRYIC